MILGIFTHYFPYGLEETARRIAAAGFGAVQLNLAFADWRFEEVDAAQCRRAAETFRRHGLRVAAIAAYSNPVATDPARRRLNRRRLEAILARARDLGSGLVVTEAGSLHPEDDWAPHAENATPAAFAEVRDALGALAETAAREGATLLIEPSVGTVIDTVEKARRLLESVASPALALVADPANYVDGTNLEEADAILDDMFRVLGHRYLLAHAKDFRRLVGAPRERHHHATDPALYGGVEYPAPGLGDLDYDRYLAHLARHCPDAPLIVEHIAEDDVPRAKRFLDARLAAPCR